MNSPLAISIVPRSTEKVLKRPMSFVICELAPESNMNLLWRGGVLTDEVVVDVEEGEADSLAVATLAVSFFSFLSFFPFLLFCSLYSFNFLHSFQVCPFCIRGLCFAHQVHPSSSFFFFGLDGDGEGEEEGWIMDPLGLCV